MSGRTSLQRRSEVARIRLRTFDEAELVDNTLAPRETECALRMSILLKWPIAIAP